MKHLFSLLFLLFLTHGGLFATVYPCSTVADILYALSVVQPGDEIVVAPGDYYPTDNQAPSGTTGTFFYATTDGTATQPIVLRGSDPANPPTFHGQNPSNRAVLRITGDHWIVQDLRLRNAQKGFILDNANDCQVRRLTIFDIGYEALHVRDGSDRTLIEYCNIYNAGTIKPGYGEGIYIGTDRGGWSNHDPHCDDTTVRHCTIGPNVAAEAFDIKEGTQNTLIEHCTIDATGISGANWADSFIDLKGVRVVIRNNVFYRNNAPKLTRAIHTHNRSVALTGYDHVIHDNVFHMDNASSGPLVKMGANTSETYAWNNVRLPAGTMYDNSVQTTCCPAWYTPPSGSCTPPTGLAASGITTEGASLLWTGGTNADTYELRHRPVGSNTWQETTGLTTTLFNLTGLNPNTTHEWQVRADCAGTLTAYVAGPDFTTTDTTSTGGGGGGNNGGGTGGGGATDPNANGFLIYDDALAMGWADYSFGGTYDLAGSTAGQIGTHAVRADYASYGGLQFKTTDDPFDVSDYDSIGFWFHSEGTFNFRLKVNGKRENFTSAGGWEYIKYPLTEFGSPNEVTKIVIQNRSNTNRICHVDHLQFIGGTTTGGGGTGGGGSGGNGGGNPDPDPPASADVVYADALGTGWNNYSFSGTYDLSSTASVAVGTYGIRADYNGWGGLNLKHNGFSTAGMTDFRFRVRGEGAYLIRLELNSEQYEFTTTTDWQTITLPLSGLGSPNTVTKVVFKNRSSQSRTVHFDQIEFVGGGNFGGSGSNALQGSLPFPNPTTAGAEVQLPLETNGEAQTFHLIDALGRTVRTYRIAPFELVRVNLPNELAAGAYWLRSSEAVWRIQVR